MSKLKPDALGGILTPGQLASQTRPTPAPSKGKKASKKSKKEKPRRTSEGRSRLGSILSAMKPKRRARDRAFPSVNEKSDKHNPPAGAQKLALPGMSEISGVKLNSVDKTASMMNSSAKYH